MTGVALTLIVRDFHIVPAEKGIVSAASLAGILFGAVLLGGLSDYFGRKRMFIAEMIIFVAFLALLILCTNFLSLAICLFGLGLALGCDYPTAHMIISENIPSVSRGKLVLGAFGFQALGALAAPGSAVLFLCSIPTLAPGAGCIATALIPALAVTIGRFFMVESANWLAVRGAHEKAEEAVNKLLLRTPQYPNELRCARRRRRTAGRRPWSSFARCSTAATFAPRSSPRCHGSSRISAPMASASSRRSSWPPRSAAAPTMSAA